MKKIIIILGMHRSGTSLLAQTLSKLGVYFGEEDELIAGDESNEKGHYEYRAIVDVHNDILYSMGKSWCSTDIGTAMVNPYFSDKYKERIRREIGHLLSNHDVAAIKDPRLAYFIPYWETMLKDMDIQPIYFHVIRKPKEVAASLEKRNGIPAEYGIHMWRFYNALIQKFLINKDAFNISFDELFLDHCIKEISDYLINNGVEIFDDCNRVAKNDLRHHFSDKEKDNIDSFDEKLLTHQANARDLSDFISESIKANENQIHVKDYDLLNDEDSTSLIGRTIVVYGAGACGRKAARLLKQIGIEQFTFCDRDNEKVGTNVEGVIVESISELEKKENLTIIIAIENQKVVRQLKYLFSWLHEFYVISFFALQRLYDIRLRDYTSLEERLGVVDRWYKELEWRIDAINRAISNDCLIYQNGKVGSSSLYRSLLESGVKCAHIHRVYYKSDLVREVKCGNESFYKNACFSDEPYLRDALNCIFASKKIITLVRDPVSVDLSTVFQWFGYGGLDRYLNEEWEMGVSFIDAVKKLTEKSRGRLLEWFIDELEPATGIDVFKYPFDRDNGYSVIKENGTEILVLQLEKLNGLYPVIESFLGINIPYPKEDNMSSQKEYSDIYLCTKKNIKFSKAYLDYYYSGNKYLDHFYSESDISIFRKRWEGT